MSFDVKAFASEAVRQLKPSVLSAIAEVKAPSNVADAVLTAFEENVRLTLARIEAPENASRPEAVQALRDDLAVYLPQWAQALKDAVKANKETEVGVRLERALQGILVAVTLVAKSLVPALGNLPIPH